MMQTSTYGSVILSSLKQNFGAYLFWPRAEIHLSVLCSRLPETTIKNGREKTVEILKDIKNYLLSLGERFTDESLIFLDEEIERYEKTIQLTIHNEREEGVSADVINQYASLKTEEGIIGIHIGFNYEQLKKLSNGVYSKNSSVNFYLSRELTIAGKIVAEFYEYPQEIIVATLAQLKKSKDGEVPQKVFLFGEKIPTTYVKLKEIKESFYIYKFISEHHREYILMVDRQYDVGDYIITGLSIETDDFKSVGEVARLPTKLPYFFAQSTQNKVVKYKTHDEFKTALQQMKITRESFFNYPFSTRTETDALVVLKHPDWFKWFTWSWIVHAKYGTTNKYPMHVLLVGPQASGKSTQTNILYRLTNELHQPFSGSSSTFTDLIPSFKSTPAKHGYLAGSNRFAFIDEFFRALIRTNISSVIVDDRLTMMNDLLEHQRRRAGSGVSEINVNMTARVWATTNPPREIHSVTDLIKRYDKSFLSRWLIYWQSQEHVDMVKVAAGEESNLERYNFELPNNDFVSLIDYLQGFKAVYDDERLMKIHDTPIPVFNEDTRDLYLSRNKHHIRCLMDGIVKTRCLMDHDMSFQAVEEDYTICLKIWSQIVKSWLDHEDINRIPIENRKYYIPEDSQYLFNLLSKYRRINKQDFKELALKEMSYNEWLNNIVILEKWGLLVEEPYTYKVYWVTEESDERIDVGNEKL